MTDAEKRGDHPDHHSMNADRDSYTCPMHPEVRPASPGTCPKCGMKLVPVEKRDDGAMDHHGHSMKPASQMSRWEKFQMSMTMTMGMEHTGLAGREMASQCCLAEEGGKGTECGLIVWLKVGAIRCDQ